MARIASEIWQLAHHLHLHEPLVKNGVLDWVFEPLQRQHIVRIELEAESMDSTIAQVHSDGTEAPRKTVRNPTATRLANAPPTVIWLPRMPEPPLWSRKDNPTMTRKGVSC